MRWQVATVVETVPETIDAVTLRLDVPDWPGHRAGQHVDLRLTADDGYTAQRSYSIASAPGADRLELTVVRLADGEVSPYLTVDVEAGDQLELRGPVGGYFVWEPDVELPVVLVGGGSGVVPLMAMIRHHALAACTTSMHLVYSARTLADLLYRDELDRLADGPRRVTITLTRAGVDGRAGDDRWDGRRGRVDAVLLADVAAAAPAPPRWYVCGPTPFVETVAGELVALGHAADDIRTERFGPTGG